jgi:hypothetical protein
LYINGNAVDPNANYQVATLSFLAEGGDNFHGFNNPTALVKTGFLDWEAWKAYLEQSIPPGQAAIPFSPIFARPGIGLDNLPATWEAGQNVSFTVNHLDTYSLGSHQVNNLTVSLGGTDLGSFPVTAGAATVSISLPANLGPAELKFVADGGNNTTAFLPITIVTPGTSPTPSTSPTGSASSSPNPSGSSSQSGGASTPPPSGSAQPTGTGSPSGSIQPSGSSQPTGTGGPSGTGVPTGTGGPSGSGGASLSTGGASSSATTDPANDPVILVKAAQTKVSILKGRKATVAVSAVKASGAKAAVTYKSSKPKVVKVAKNGKLTARKAGKAVITVTAGGKKVSITVRVVTKKAKVKAVKAKAPKQVKVGQIFGVAGSVSPTKATAIVTYKSATKSVISIDKAGKAVALKAGKSKITVKAGGKRKTVTITVK